MKCFIYRLHLVAFLLLPLLSAAQIDDVGLWLGITAEKQVTRDASISLEQQIRFNHDVTDINLLLTDFGFEYSFFNNFKAGIHYRFINKNEENYYSKRHRLYVDLSYKHKFSFITLTLRERLQEQFTDINSSENGEIPEWVLRSKLTAKIDLDKNYTPYVSGEVYYVVDNASNIDRFYSRVRFETGFDYKFNRMNSVNPFIIYQHRRMTNFDELIYGIGYTLSF